MNRNNISKYNVVILDTDENMEKILSASKKIFSKPLSEKQCHTLLETIICFHLSYNDNVEELEDTLFEMAEFFEFLEDNLFGDNDDGQQELRNAPF